MMQPTILILSMFTLTEEMLTKILENVVPPVCIIMAVSCLVYVVIKRMIELIKVINEESR